MSNFWMEYRIGVSILWMVEQLCFRLEGRTFLLTDFSFNGRLFFRFSQLLLVTQNMFNEIQFVGKVSQPHWHWRKKTYAYKALHCRVNFHFLYTALVLFLCNSLWIHVVWDGIHNHNQFRMVWERKICFISEDDKTKELVICFIGGSDMLSKHNKRIQIIDYLLQGRRYHAKLISWVALLFC